MKALIITKNRKAVIKEVPEPELRPDYFKVKPFAVAINPTDFHHTASAGAVGGILGCDLSGIVEEVGPECKSDIKVGDKVYGVCHCAPINNPGSGSYAEHVLVKDGHIAKIPDHITFEQAATLGVAITSVGQSLYMKLGLPLPGQPLKEKTFILINGGSSATGSLAIQFAKLSGLTVLTTTSPTNFPLIKSLGADAVFDYHDHSCGQQIRSYTQNSLYYIYDTISTPTTFKICADAFPETAPPNQGLNLLASLPLENWTRTDVKAQNILAYTTFGESFTKFGVDFPGYPEHFEFGVMFWKVASKLLREGKIIPHPVLLRGNGLYGIPKGIVEAATGKVSAGKLVYRVAETGDEPAMDVEGPAVGRAGY